MPVSTLHFDPTPDGACRVCRGSLDPESWLCTRCGAAHGERNRCPHCRSIARTLRHPTLHHRCSVCGRPRFLPGLQATFTSSDAQYQLQASSHAHRVGTILRYLGYFFAALGVPGLLLTALVLLILMPGAWVSGIALSFAWLPLVLWLVLRSRAKATLAARDQALDQAYLQAAIASLRQTGLERDTESLAAMLGLPLERTERLLLQLNSDERMTSRVTDDGALVFGAVISDRRRIADLSHETDDAMSRAIVDAELEESSTQEEPSRQRHE